MANNELPGRERIALLLEELADANGFTFHKLREQLFLFSNSNYQFSVIANNWPHNSSSAYKLAWDKEASHRTLTISGIQSVEQIYVRNSDDLAMDKAKAFFIMQGGYVVLKNNFGVNGTSVMFCENDLTDFEKKVIMYFTRYGSVNISKKIEIANEYRCIVLCGNVELIYQKNRPKIIGDGKSPIITLLSEAQYKILKLKSEIENNLYKIPEKNEIVTLSDQDNLSLGSTPTVINIKNSLSDNIKDMAIKTALALDLNFCAIDILLDNNGELIIMEANSGIMFTNFITASSENEKEVRRIFNKAIQILISK